MITLVSGKTLSPADLSLAVRDAQGRPTPPYRLVYSIFQVQAGDVLVPVVIQEVPVDGGSGAYHVGLTIPTAWPAGTYRLVWELQQTVDDPNVAKIYEDFAIITLRPETSSVEAPSVLLATRLSVTAKIADLVMTVRELISDTNPDRNYHFRPPTAAKTVAGYTTRVGFIWMDESILRFLRVAVARMNTANPKTNYGFTLEDLPQDWSQVAAVGAASYCLKAEGARWIAEEFGYSLNGVSLDLEKSSKYQGLGESYATEFAEWLPSLTAVRPASRGLRQWKYIR